MSHYLAFDFGAESGRALLGSLSGGRLGVEELHRFPNTPVGVLGALYWDTLRSKLRSGRRSGADPIVVRDHRFERQPPQFAEPIRKAGRDIDRERHPRLFEHRIGHCRVSR